MSEIELIEKYQKQLGCTADEARELIEYDREVDHSSGGLEYDLPAEKNKVAQSFTKTGTRTMKETGLRLTKRERKPNELKGSIIAEIFTFLTENAGFGAENVEIKNKERMIAFDCGGEKFEITLTQKRKPKN